MDQLHMHFTQAIHNTVFQVVLGYVELCAGNADTKFQKMQYKDLCTVRNECEWLVDLFYQFSPFLSVIEQLFGSIAFDRCQCKD